MNQFKTTSIVVGILFLMVLMSSLFTVTQGYHGIKLRLGRLVIDEQTDKPVVLGAGLHLKTPFIDTVQVFDTRLQTLDIKSSRIVTKEKKDVLVDCYVKWEIKDLAVYFKSTGGNEFKAATLLEQQLNTGLRAEFGKRTISDLVSGERDDVMEVLRQKADRQAAALGIVVVDVRIKGIELPANTSNAIYQRMRADMKKIANRHRADGQATAEAIQAAADAKVTVLLAQAKSDGLQKRAAGAALAASIYSKAYNQNKPFFNFYRSLKAYETAFSQKQDLFVLDESSSFFDYFKHSLNTTGGAKPSN